MRRPLVAGNWKMYKGPQAARDLARAVRRGWEESGGARGGTTPEILLCPPFVSLAAVAAELAGGTVALGAQNLHWEREGAFTGEVSGPMLKEAGATWVIVGHSERRQHFGETDETIRLRVGAALEAGLRVIVCVGETLDERETGGTEAVVRRQVSAGLAGIAGPDWERLVIAYEPVWAIGTGRTATPETAGEVHSALRSLVRDRAGDEVAQALRILYGGSVKPDNAASLFAVPDIDGGLVGGASLDPESFLQIARCARSGSR
jgi:triosephosphate isomerase